MTTSGAFENLEVLAGRPDDHTIGLSETGIETLLEGYDPGGLVSLGSVRATPFWLIVRRDRHSENAERIGETTAVPRSEKLRLCQVFGGSQARRAVGGQILIVGEDGRIPDRHPAAFSGRHGRRLLRLEQARSRTAATIRVTSHA